MKTAHFMVVLCFFIQYCGYCRLQIDSQHQWRLHQLQHPLPARVDSARIVSTSNGPQFDNKNSFLTHLQRRRTALIIDADTSQTFLHQTVRHVIMNLVVTYRSRCDLHELPWHTCRFVFRQSASFGIIYVHT